jgi:hypothetical protein
MTILKRWHELMLQNKDDLAKILMFENGRPIGAAGLPKGVFNIVTTNKTVAEVGKEMCETDEIKNISFTGSTGRGKIIDGSVFIFLEEAITAARRQRPIYWSVSYTCHGTLLINVVRLVFNDANLEMPSQVSWLRNSEPLARMCMRK